MNTKKPLLCTTRPPVLAQNVPVPPSLKCTETPPRKFTRKPAGGFSLVHIWGLYGGLIGTFWEFFLDLVGGFLVHFGGFYGTFLGRFGTIRGILWCNYGGFRKQFRGFQVHIWGFSVHFVSSVSGTFSFHALRE